MLKWLKACKDVKQLSLSRGKRRGHAVALNFKTVSVCVFNLQLEGVRISIATGLSSLIEDAVALRCHRWVLEAFRTLSCLNTVQQGKWLQMVWLETVHAWSRGAWQAGMLAWDGKVTAPAPAIYWGLFGLCPVKPCCFFPQLKPRLNCRGRDQSPAEARATATVTYTRRMCFFLHTFKDV